LLGRFPLEARLPPHFELMDERSSAELLADATETVLSRAQANITPGLTSALADVSGRVMAQKFQELTRALAFNRGRFSRLLAAYDSVDGVAKELRRLFHLADEDSEQSIVSKACPDEAFDVVGLRKVVAALLDGGKTDAERSGLIGDWLAQPSARADGFDHYLSAFFTEKGTIRSTLATKAVIKNMPDAAEILTAEAERLFSVQNRRRLARITEATVSLLRVGEAQLAEYGEAKSRHAVLDYEDLILETRKLLQLPDVAPWILYKLDGGIDHVLIDEAQDTSPDQWRVVATLAEEFFSGQSSRDGVRSIFAVGDVKQSIYSFQGADPAEFEAMRRHFQERASQAEQPFRQVPLDTSFRSTEAVLRLVDEVFATDEARDGLVFGDDAVRHHAFREGQAGLVELWAPIQPDEKEDFELWSPPIHQMTGANPEEKLAIHIADRIRQWLDRGEILQSRGRAVAPGDIMILVRRRTAFVGHLVNELKRKNIPVAGSDRMVLTEQLAVMDLIALGRFVLLPEDDLTLAEVLKGPFVGMDDDDLFQIAYDRGERTLWQSLRAHAPRGGVFSEAVSFLSDQLARADYVPPFEFYARVLGPCGGRRRMVARLGREANDPIDELMNLALEYERAHPPSLEGFLHWIDAADTEVKRDLEDTGDQVRVMTIHGAKGLEAPIVFLPDTTGKPTQDDGFLWLKDSGKDAEGEGLSEDDGTGLLIWPVRRENEIGPCDTARQKIRTTRDQEYRRLLYVALTRAEDRLYVCGWETHRGRVKGCWYDLVAEAFDRITGVEDVDGVDGEAARRYSNPQTRAVDGVSPFTQPCAVVPLRGWAHIAPAAEPVPPRPLAPSRPEDDPPPVLSPIDQKHESGGLARGQYVHTLLQLLPDLPPEGREDAARHYLAQAGGDMGEGQLEELIAEVMNVLNDPDFAPLFGPNSQAEVPVAGMVGEFALSGQIDRLVVTDDEVLIVDYKTNRNPPKNECDVSDAYLNQMAIYRAALRTIFPELPVRCALLWTEGPTLMPLTESLMNERSP
ncbi:MAG: double-strand break repair helicase AddA, partial [Rhodospirillales bacterium]|nr:double-strand break repair helicase AddA [Rhodospirillales bacterium]